jgi:thiol-disulfide isomerase/thioredoxin
MNRSPAFPENAPRSGSSSRLSLVVGLMIACGVGGGIALWVNHPASANTLRAQNRKVEDTEKAPDLVGGIAWLNTAKPLSMKDLRGKIVVLDFWTLCCINCIHTLPDLAKLEKKYADQLVVVGVHSPKFENEKDTNSIRKAILRYEIQHPVVNDADQKIWTAFGCRSWPTLAVIDPEGNYLGQLSGEGHYERLDKFITTLIEKHRKNKTLNETAVRFDTAQFRDNPTPLYFPGKVLADEKSNRLFIADSTHHRIVVTDLDGNKIAIAGAGQPGRVDGPFASATFEDPQGMALSGDTLYVADRRNHCIRELDLKKQTVKTIAGTGQQERDRAEGGDALRRGLNSPWDLHLDGDTLYIAMAGHHQIWTLNLKSSRLDVYAGDGAENIKDGPLFAARFAQPSGLATDGKNLYVADCEVSAIRKVPKGGTGRVETLVGTGLFDFGDVDGIGKSAVLQHAIGVGFHEGKLYVADTYNSKIKTIDLATREVKTFLGGHDQESWYTDLILNEPCGLSFANGNMYVADTNSHRIRVVDLKTKAISTLALKGVEPVGKK